MNAVVSMLDENAEQMVRELWQDLEARFDIRGVLVTPYPHFSYQIALAYKFDQIENILKRIAASSKPFVVRTSGLGIFTGESPVLYLPILRNNSLNAMHHQVWEMMESPAIDPVMHYRAESWVPHITIGFGDMYPDKLRVVIEQLTKKSWEWEITINNISFIQVIGTRQFLQYQFLLGEI